MKKNITFLIFWVCTSFSYAQVKSIRINELPNIINQAQNDLVVVNFWATFCKPCLEEIPVFIKAEKRNKSMTLILVSVDARDVFTQKLDQFVRKHMRNELVYWLNETDASYFCPMVDSSWEGTIPATLFVNKRNHKRLFVEGEMNETDLEKTIDDLIK